MTDPTTQELIRQSPLGAELDDGQIERLATCVTVRDLGDEEVLFNEGDADNTLYIVARGRLEVVRDAGDGDVVSLHLLRGGDITGEMGFIDGSAHSATLRAIGHGRVLKLVRADLEKLLDEDAHLVYNVMRAILRTVHVLVRRMNVQFLELSNYISKQHGRY